MDSPLLPVLSKFDRDGRDEPMLSLSNMTIGSDDDEARDPISPSKNPSLLLDARIGSKTDDLGVREQELESALPQLAKPRFSLFAPHQGHDDLPSLDSETREDKAGFAADKTREEATEYPERGLKGYDEGEKDKQQAQGKERALKEGLYQLREFNEAFDVFLEALKSSREHNERLSIMVKHTSALLDQYTALLGQAQHTQRLLSDPKWTGSSDDAPLALSQATAARQ
ncbi:uncharacterized protein L203_103836 [Cryptococcus depauperatus CBS 7841]|uniref:DASH complex subunit DUO1 n=1 Tax=Cryptococcus depauperatus CBS 7841 TaxID=1295531 RepID=A0A1E3IE66_9TREE|nr:hypothetical protein L203_03663 [Cryptococcus depauperatus CBS 7841]